MNRTPQGRLIGLPTGANATDRVTREQKLIALRLLAIIAFHTKVACQEQEPTWTEDWLETGNLPSRPEDKPPEYVYNITDVNQSDALKRGPIRDAFKRHCPDSDFIQSWQGLATLNSGFLENGLFEDDTADLVELVWSNRSLHEFLLSYYFANLATEDDTRYLWDWIYIKDNYDTEDYYWFWIMLTGMPEASTASTSKLPSRDGERWLQSIRLLYQGLIKNQRNRAVENRHFAKRSNEMVFRSFKCLIELRLDRKLSDLASRIIEDWRSEFNCMLNGNHGEAEKQISESLRNHLLEVPLAAIGKFKMGTLPGKQGRSLFNEIPPSLLAQIRRLRSEPAQYLQEYFETFDSTRSITASLEHDATRLLRVTNAPDETTAATLFVTWLWAENEREIAYEGLPNAMLSEYSLGRFCCTNEFYRLFDPTYGTRETGLFDGYKMHSAHPEAPVVYVDWFDAWVYCQWTHWDGLSCMLPREDHWECAAKFGFGWSEFERPYWWDEGNFDAERDLERIRCRETLTEAERMTQVPSIPIRSSFESRRYDPEGRGWMDMLGACSEWCIDPFPNFDTFYVRDASSVADCPNVHRSIRGGASDKPAIVARNSARRRNLPHFTNHVQGFRLARRVRKNDAAAHR
ncbi:formylglycine-generating enzyme family protein [Novipirellula maiorica]